MRIIGLRGETMKAVYPIILTPAERGYVVFVPDLDINTEGEDLADAIEMDLRTVRKNVTLPSWLNDLAERNGVNFSQVLQESLKERLHVSNR